MSTSSTSAGVASKRKADESVESSTAKRTKKSGSDPLREELLKQATSLLDALKDKTLIRTAKNWELLEEDRLCMIRIVKKIISSDKQYSEAVLKGIRIPLDLPDEWPQQFTHKQIDASRAIIEEVIEGAQNVAQLYEALLISTKAAPSPSLYNHIHVWHEWQKKENAILCLRPKEKHGLPLWILADVFRQFRLMAKAPLPKDTVAANVALQVAYDLCDQMGEAFLKEKERSARFQDCIGSFFSPGQWSQQSISAKSEIHSAYVDGCLSMEGIICIFREVKVELGEGHDAYLQLARDYQIYIARLRDNNDHVLLQRGAPTFLLCLIGPVLLIAGGFWDGVSTIVQPLLQPYIMLFDMLDGLQQDLAGLLYALKEAVGILVSSQREIEKPQKFNPKVPRVYPSFKPLTLKSLSSQDEVPLTFESPLHQSSSKPLLFLATVPEGNSKAHRVVKLVNSQYGSNVHQTLVKHGLAPVLHGYCHLDGAPTAYVMEYLAPLSTSSPSEGWKTLHDFAESHDAGKYKNDIWTALDHLLTIMENERVVHGDLRANNLMIKVDTKGSPSTSGAVEGGVCLKVVDFDWAGNDGEVCYPSMRNESIPWPAGAGEPIVIGYDRKLVDTWWPTLIPPSK